MVIGVLKEPQSDTRVSLLPESVAALIKKGVKVEVEKGAGERSFSGDNEYIKAGATISSREEVLNHADIILTINPPIHVDLDSRLEKEQHGAAISLFEKEEHKATISLLEKEEHEAAISLFEKEEHKATISPFEKEEHKATISPLEKEEHEAAISPFEKGGHDDAHEEILRGGFSNKILIGVYQPLFNKDLMNAWANNNITAFSLDMLPRTTRAQSMDVLSSQANIAGYKAVLLAATTYSRYFPMFMTAAGSIPPAKVLILGAGVAGLQAIATARRLGAVVEVFDTRPAVKEEVMSLGAKFIEVEGAADASKAGGYAVEQSADFIQRQKQKIADSAAKADIVITTAQIPGRKAPILITSEMISAMKKGSVIIDLAAATGGNTDHTKNNETVNIDGVTIVGNSLLAATMPSDASKLYGRNVLNFLQLIIDKDGNLFLNFDDELVKGACITHEGKLLK